MLRVLLLANAECFRGYLPRQTGRAANAAVETDSRSMSDAPVLVEIDEPTRDASSTLEDLCRRFPHGTAVFVMGGTGCGASDSFLSQLRPVVRLSQAEFSQALNYARSSVTTGDRPTARADQDGISSGFDNLVGCSPGIRDIARFILTVAQRDATVLITGESGTGKELVARSIHNRGRRRGRPFVAVNCSAIPSSLVESEFFGFERGAFTDAKEPYAGKFEQADKGTLFLDEIGDLPLDAQAKLLRVLQDHEVTRIGSRRPIRVDARILAATNKDLESAVRRGQFREDLFWRLNVLTVRLPPLRERPGDVELLLDAFSRRFSAELGKGDLRISPCARRLLLAHDWPGNVRELENTLHRAFLLCDGPVLSARDLPLPLREPIDGASGASGDDPPTLVDAVDTATRRIERTCIGRALVEHGGNRGATARALGINRKTLFRKMREYGLAVVLTDTLIAML